MAQPTQPPPPRSAHQRPKLAARSTSLPSARLASLVALLILPTVVAAIGPRAASIEDLHEQADSWLLDYDEDEDGRLSESELGPVISEMRERSTGSDPNGLLNAAMLLKMADADGDKAASKPELLNLLKRMKGYDAGHLNREEANTPQQAAGADAGAAAYGESHERRMRKKKKQRRTRAPKGKPGKDEV
jgi:hypothetical protein